jgi:nicotinamide riboside transporter PnuC
LKEIAKQKLKPCDKIFLFTNLYEKMLDAILQTMIFVLGVGAIILISKKNKWGFVLGLLSQPFWIITSYNSDQWGIFFLSLVYTVTWGFGIYEWFFKKKKLKLKTLH